MSAKLSREKRSTQSNIDFDDFLFGLNDGKDDVTIEAARRCRASLYEVLKQEFDPQGD